VRLEFLVGAVLTGAVAWRGGGIVVATGAGLAVLAIWRLL
jgi:hypothetical protein